MQKITPFLWFDGRAEEAARFYVSIFRNSKIVSIARYPEAGNEVHGQPVGMVMTVAFELDGQTFTALNGGPVFMFNEAISFVVDCADQEEVDYYWKKLGENGDAQAQQCGWLKDQYGLSWQIVPRVLIELMSDPAKTGRVMEAMLQMKKNRYRRLAPCLPTTRSKTMIYKGSCHCGQVRFEVEGELERVMDCNCSICARKGALLWFVPRDKLTLLTPEENLADYRFGDATIRHRFCKVCGIHPLGEGSDAAGNHMAAINVRCLENVDFAALPVDHYDGRAL